MLDLKLAKSRMENEEGMNHLWIQLFRDEKKPKNQKSRSDYLKEYTALLTLMTMLRTRESILLLMASTGMLS